MLKIFIVFLLWFTQFAHAQTWINVNVNAPPVQARIVYDSRVTYYPRPYYNHDFYRPRYQPIYNYQPTPVIQNPVYYAPVDPMPVRTQRYYYYRQ